MIFLAETFEGDGWIAHSIEAATHAEAVEIAHARFVGTRGYHTLQVDPEPLVIQAPQRVEARAS